MRRTECGMCRIEELAYAALHAEVGLDKNGRSVPLVNFLCGAPAAFDIGLRVDNDIVFAAQMQSYCLAYACRGTGDNDCFHSWPFIFCRWNYAATSRWLSCPVR